MQYEHLRQWRDICEFLDRQWYKFVDQNNIANRGFTLLLPSAKTQREQMWSDYMIQFAQYGQHPHANYHNYSDYRKDYGWRLLPDWESKIDFLEQITLFNRNPDDLSKAWRRAIWERFFARANRKLEHEQEIERWWQQRQEERQQKLKEGDCPAKFRCQDMTGAIAAGECLNFEQCKRLVGSL